MSRRCCASTRPAASTSARSAIYLLLRELAAGGAAVLLYTSELEEIQLACDRAIVIFGAVVDEIAGTDADEATLLRAAHAASSRQTRDRSDERAERPGGACSGPPVRRGSWRRNAGRNTCTIALLDAGRTACVHPRDQADVRRVRPGDAVEGRVAAAFAAVAQAIIVISGGIDLLDRVDDGPDQRHRGAADEGRLAGGRGRVVVLVLMGFVLGR